MDYTELLIEYSNPTDQRYLPFYYNTFNRIAILFWSSCSQLQTQIYFDLHVRGLMALPSLARITRFRLFPLFSSAAWIVSEEDFLSVKFAVNLPQAQNRLGKTGSQEFPGGSSVVLYKFTNNGGYGQINNPNPDLKWQANSTVQCRH